MVEFDSVTPAMPPPPGQSSNFVDPAYIGTKFLVVNCVFLPMSAIALLVRTWTRLFIVHSFRSDDYLMIFAWILSCVLTGVTLEMLNRGLGRHMWDVHAADYSPWFLKLNMISAIFYCAATGLTKVSVLIFYVRIFPTRTFHICVWAIAAVAILYNVASVFANFLGCSPIAKTWDITITKGSCMNRPVFYFANAGLGIFTDFATVLVPIPWLRRLQMPLRQKIAVACILAMGCFVGIISCVRLATLYDLLKTPDLTWATTDALMWCTIELNLGITGGCVTAIRPFVRRYFPRLLGLSSAENTSRSRKYAHPLGSIPRTQPDFASPRDHQYSTTAHAHNESEEHILSPSPGPKEDGILRTVEFDIENSGRSIGK